MIPSDSPAGRGALLWLLHMARGRSDCQSAAWRASISSCTVTTIICSQRQRVHVDMRMNSGRRQHRVCRAAQRASAGAPLWRRGGNERTNADCGY